MKNNLIVTDLDGTLLNNKHEISTQNQKWIKKFKASGGLFTFATGRMEDTALPYAEQLNIDIPIISYNGARIYCPIRKRILYEQSLKIPKEIWEIIKSTKQENGVFIYSDGNSYVLERNSIVKEFEEKEKMQCILHQGDGLKNDPLTKVLLIMRDVQELNRIRKEIVQDGFNCETVFSEINYLEILPAGVSKGKGLTKLINYLNNHSPIHTIAVGDNLNDISLLQTADNGIAVANARKELKAVADVVLEQSNEEDAIAKLIENLEGKTSKLNV